MEINRCVAKNVLPALNIDKIIEVLFLCYGECNLLCLMLNTCTIDLYFLLLLFSQDNTIKTNVVYTGDYHVTIYKKFFELYFNISANITMRNNDEQYLIFDDKKENESPTSGDYYDAQKIIFIEDNKVIE